MFHVNFFVVVFLTTVCLQQVLSHSWIACTDYTEKNGRYYDHDKCRGYARTSKTFAPRGGTFGEDRGYNHHASETKPCRNGRNDGTEYDTNHPIAVYYPGQQVVIAHPMKNHGSDSCTNPYVPDNGSHIYRGEKNARGDPTLSDFKKNLIADLGAKDIILPLGRYPRPGYQNAPAFCEDPDKALGTYSFNVPKDIKPGRYTFIWLWKFNLGENIYSTCFEVDIVKNRIRRNAKLVSNGFRNFYEPCGGKTSKTGTIGNYYPGCKDRGRAINPTRPRTRTTPKPATTLPTMAPRKIKLPALVHEMFGEVNLPPADVGTRRREIGFFWPCPVVVNFRSAFITKRLELPGARVRYKIIQEGSDIAAEKFYYHASFTQPCDLETNHPVVKLVSDEK